MLLTQQVTVSVQIVDLVLSGKLGGTILPPALLENGIIEKLAASISINIKQNWQRSGFGFTASYGL